MTGAGLTIRLAPSQAGRIGKRLTAYLRNLRLWGAVSSMESYAPCPALVAG
jgi:hypothetical protein